MFVQFVTGTVIDADLLARQQQRWFEELRPDTPGLLGSTMGLTLNGRSVSLLRFASTEDAHANAARPEQTAWWNETAKAFDYDLAVRDCADVDSYVDDITSATFVALVQGRPKDKGRMCERNAEFASSFRELGALGMLVGWDAEGGFSNAMFFRTEADARAIEAATDLEQLDQFLQLIDGDPTYYELPSPIHG